MGASQNLTIPPGHTLAITYGATDDTAGLTANGTIVNNGTISIAYSGMGGEGLLSTDTGTLVNNGKITISDTGYQDLNSSVTLCSSPAYNFCGGYGLDSFGAVTNNGTITATEAGGPDTRALFTSGTLSNSGVMTVAVDPATCAIDRDPTGSCGATGWTNNNYAGTITGGTITNSGSIDFDVVNLNAPFHVDGIYNLLGTIINTGTIAVTGGADRSNGVENDGGMLTVAVAA